MRGKMNLIYPLVLYLHLKKSQIHLSVMGSKISVMYSLLVVHLHLK